MTNAQYRRVPLSSIKSLTLFYDEYTSARRASPVPQLSCVGKVCELFQPEAAQCFNIGGTNTDVKWKCEADLPENLRFGKVSVSCEGWSGPGDPYVLEGSCGLEYRLLHVPEQFRKSSLGDSLSYRRLINRWLNPDNAPAILFNIVWFGILVWFAYTIYKSCVRAHREANPRRASGGMAGGWFGSGAPRPPPPPYAPYDPHASKPSSESGWTPGFWTGLGLGGLAASIWNSGRATEDQRFRRQQAQYEYDWERARMGASPSGLGYGWTTPTPASRRAHASDSLESEGAGPSGLGNPRRSTGLGGSTVR